MDLFFPKFCFGCQKEGIYLCDDCKETLEISEHNYCLCEINPSRLLFNLPGIPSESKQGRCPKCSSRKLSGLYFALPYKEKSLTRKLIHQFKYEPYTKDLAKTLARLIIEHLVKTKKNTDEVWQNSVLIPIPLDKKKMKIRSYNQSEELAKELANVLNLPVLSDVLIKIKPTKPQMELKKEEREKNLLNAFRVSFPRKRESSPSLRGAEATKQSFSLAGKKIFLIDDVYTTGSTMEECAKVLKNAGAKSVWGICIAREG